MHNPNAHAGEIEPGLETTFHRLMSVVPSIPSADTAKAAEGRVEMGRSARLDQSQPSVTGLVVDPQERGSSRHLQQTVEARLIAITNL